MDVKPPSSYCPTPERLYFSHLRALYRITLFGALCLHFWNFYVSQHWKVQLNWTESAHRTCWGSLCWHYIKTLIPFYNTYTSFNEALTTACLNRGGGVGGEQPQTPDTMGGSNWGIHFLGGPLQRQDTGMACNRKSKVWRVERLGQVEGKSLFFTCMHFIIIKRKEIIL